MIRATNLTGDRLKHGLVLSAILFSNFAAGQQTTEDDDAPCARGSSIDPSPDWVNYGGFIFLIVLVIMMFWALALVCEEYFVPALNIMCEVAKIPDDVAGATFMAAGASSPEMFTGFIGLLIYDSNIGVGTVVGSEIFNHMIISTGSVLFAAGGVLYLDARILLRDLITYMLLLLWLVWSLKGFHNGLADAFDQSTWDQCLDVSLLHSGTLILFYGVYATISGNYQRLVRTICPRPPVEEESSDPNAKADAQAAAISQESGNGTVNPLTGAVAAGGTGSVRPSESDAMEHPPRSSMSRASVSLRPSVIRNYDAPRASFREGPLYEWHTADTDADAELQITDERRSIMDEQAGKLHRRHERRRTPAEMTGRRSSEFSRPSMFRPSVGGVRPMPRQSESTVGTETKNRVTTEGIELSDSPASSSNNDVEEGKRDGGTRAAAVVDAERRSSAGEVGDLYRESAVGQYENPAVAAAAKILSIETKKRSTTLPYMVSPALNTFYDILGVADPVGYGDIEEGDGVLKCYLHIRTDVIDLDALPPLMMWGLRYFTIDALGLYSTKYPDDDKTGPHVEIIDLTDAAAVTVTDKSKLLFQVEFKSPTTTADDDGAPGVGAALLTQKQPLQFRAPSEEILTLMIGKVEELVARYSELNDMQKEMEISTAREVLWKEVAHGEEGFHGHTLLTPPKGRYALYWFYLCYPLRFMFHYTLSDVNQPKNRGKFAWVIAGCGIWLAALSYIMILCCDYLGDWIGASPIVMGLTLSAVGTSFPNLWSSMVVARQGLGSMAIGNALGSNIFNIAIALGCPWFVKALLQGGASYREMPDHGIVLLIILLEITCVIWFATIYFAGFRMYAWMSWIYIAMYLAVLITSIALQ